MSPPYVSIKNLEQYQHYKHRNPPWVKLHYSILDDPAFLALDEVQQCRYIKLIMLASRQLNCISTDPSYLGRVMRIPEQVDLTPLIDAGFLIASRKRQSPKMLAPLHENPPQSRVEKSREEKSREESTPPVVPQGDQLRLAASSNNWGTPLALMELWNAECPNECAAAETLSPKRRERAARLLKSFPDKAYWQEALKELNKSPFLRGMSAPSKGHSRSFIATFDWFLSCSKDGTENVVQVWEQKYGR